MHLSYIFGCSLHQVIETMNKCRIQDSNIKQFIDHGPASTVVVFQGSRDDIAWIQENIIKPYAARALVTAVRDDQENQSELVLEGYKVYTWIDATKTARAYMRVAMVGQFGFDEEVAFYRQNKNQYTLVPLYSVKVPETEL